MGKTSQVKWKVPELWVQAGCYMALYILVYGSISLRSGLLWDEMLDAEGTATGTYVGAGRWGLALYRCVFGEGMFPVVAPLVAGVFISISLVWQTRMLALETWLHRLFYGALYLASIQWAFQLEYSHQCDAVALGLLGSTAAVVFCMRGRWVAATLCIIPALGMYQTIGLHTVCLMLAVGVAGGGDPRWGWLLKCAVCLAAAMAVSLLASRAACLLPWVSEEEIATQQRYMVDMSRWSEYPAGASVGEQAGFLGYYGSRFFKMTCKNMLGCAYAGQWVYATVLLPLAVLVAGAVRSCRPWHAVGRCAVYYLLWILPFCPILLLFTDQGARVNMAEPLALASLWGLALPQMARWNKKWLPSALAILACVAVLKSAYRVGDIAWNEARIFEQEVACVRALHTRGMGAAEAAGVEAPQIILLGQVPAHREVTWPRRECFADHTPMTPPEKLDFYTRYLGLGNVRKASPQEAVLHEAAYKAMPTWPAAGSVRVDAGVVIIRVD